MSFSRFVSLFLVLALAIEPMVPLYAKTPGDITSTSDISQPAVVPSEVPETSTDAPPVGPLEAADNPLSESTDPSIENPSPEPTPSPSPSVSSIPMPSPTPMPSASVFSGFTPHIFSESEPYTTVPGPDTILLRPAGGENSSPANDFLLLRPDNNNNSWRYLILNGSDPAAVDLASAIEIQGNSAQFMLPGGQQIQISISADGLSATAGLQQAAPEAEPEVQESQMPTTDDPANENAPAAASGMTVETWNPESMNNFFSGNTFGVQRRVFPSDEELFTSRLDSISLSGTGCATNGPCYLRFENNGTSTFFNTGLLITGADRIDLRTAEFIGTTSNMSDGMILNGVPITAVTIERNDSGQVSAIHFMDEQDARAVTFRFREEAPAASEPAPVEVVINGRSQPDPMNFSGPTLVFDPPATSFFRVQGSSISSIRFFEGTDTMPRGLDFTNANGTFRLQLPQAPSDGSNSLTITFPSDQLGGINFLDFTPLSEAAFPFSFRNIDVQSAVMTYDDAGNPASVSLRDEAGNSLLRFVFPAVEAPTEAADFLTAEEGDIPVITEAQLRLETEDEGLAEEDDGEPQELADETRAQMQSVLSELNYALQRVMTVGDIDDSALAAIRSANQTVRNFNLLNPDDSITGNARRDHRQFANAYRDMMDRIGAFASTLGSGAAAVPTPAANDLPDAYQSLLSDLENPTLAGIRIQQSILRQLARDRDDLWAQALSQTAAREQWTNTPVTMGGIAYNNYAAAYENEIQRTLTRLNALMESYRQESGPRLRALADQFQAERPAAPATLTAGQIFRNGFMNDLAYYAENFGTPQAGRDMGAQLDDLRTRASQAVQTADARGESIPQEEQAFIFNLIDLLRGGLPAAIAPPPADGQFTFVDTNGVTRTGTLRLGEIPPGTVRSDNPFTAGVAGVFESENYRMVWNAQSTPIQSVEVRTWVEDGKMWMEEKNSSGAVARQKGYVLYLTRPGDTMQSGPTGPREWRVTEIDYTDGTTDGGEPPPYDLVPEALRQAMRTSMTLPDGTEARVVLPSVNLDGGKKLTLVNPYLMEIRQGENVVSWQVNLESLIQISLGNPAARLAEARRIAQGILQGGGNAVQNAIIAGTIGQLRFDAENSVGASLNFSEMLAQFLIDLTGANASESQTNATADTGGRSTLRWPGALSLTIAADSSISRGNLTFMAEYTENGLVTRRIPAFFGMLSDAPANFVPSTSSGVARLGYGLVVLEGYRQGWRTSLTGPYLDPGRTMSAWIDREYKDTGGAVTLSMFSTVNNTVSAGFFGGQTETETRWVTRGTPRINSSSSSNGVVWDFSAGGDWIFLNQAQASGGIPSFLSVAGQSMASNPLSIVPRLAIQGSSAAVSTLVSGARYGQAELLRSLGVDLAVENELAGISNEIVVMTQNSAEEDMQQLQRGQVPNALSPYLERAKSIDGGTLVLDYMVRLRRRANTRPDAQTGASPGTRDAMIDAPVTDAQRAFELVRWRTPGELSNLRAMAGEDAFFNGAIGFLGNLNRTIADMGPMLIALHFLGAAGAAAARVPATAEAVAVVRATSGIGSVSQANVFTHALRFSSMYVQYTMVPGMAVSLPQHISDAVNAFSEGRFTDFSDSATGAIMDGIFTYMIASGLARSAMGGGGGQGAPDGFTNMANGLIDAVQGWRPGTSSALMPYTGAIPRIRNNSNRQTLIDQSARVESLQNQINQLAPSEAAQINQLNVQLRSTLQGMRYLVELDFVQHTMAEMAANRDPSTLSGEEATRYEFLRTRANHINEVLREVYPDAVPGGEIVLGPGGSMSGIGNSGSNNSSGQQGQTNLTPGQTGANTRPVSTRPGGTAAQTTNAGAVPRGTNTYRLPDGRVVTVKPKAGQIIRFRAPDRNGQMQSYEFDTKTNILSRMNGEVPEVVTFGGAESLQAGGNYQLGGNDNPLNFSNNTNANVGIRILSEADVAPGARFAGEQAGSIRITNRTGQPLPLRASVEIGRGGTSNGSVAPGERVAVTTDGMNQVQVITPEGTFTLELNPANAEAGTWSFSAWRNGTTRVPADQLPFKVIRGNTAGDYFIENSNSSQPISVQALQSGGRSAALRSYAAVRAPLPRIEAGAAAGEVYTVRLNGTNSEVRYQKMDNGTYRVTYSAPDAASSTGRTARTQSFSEAQLQNGVTINDAAGNPIIKLRLVTEGARPGLIIENMTESMAELSVSDRVRDGQGQQIVDNTNNTNNSETRPADNNQTPRDTLTDESTPIDPASQPQNTQGQNTQAQNIVRRNMLAQLLTDNINAQDATINSRILEFVRDPSNRPFIEQLIGPQGANEATGAYEVRALGAIRSILDPILRNPLRPVDEAALRGEIGRSIDERIEQAQQFNQPADPRPQQVEEGVPQETVPPAQTQILEQGAISEVGIGPLRLGETRTASIPGTDGWTVEVSRSLSGEDGFGTDVLNITVRNRAGQTLDSRQVSLGTDAMVDIDPAGRIIPHSEGNARVMDITVSSDGAVTVDTPLAANSNVSAPPPQQVIEASGRIQEGSSLQRFEGATQYTTQSGERFTVSRTSDGSVRVTVDGRDVGTNFRLGDQQIQVSIEGETGFERITIESSRAADAAQPAEPARPAQPAVEEPPARLVEEPAAPAPSASASPGPQNAGPRFVEMAANETVTINGIEVRLSMRIIQGENGARPLYFLEILKNGQWVDYLNNGSLGEGVEVQLGAGSNSTLRTLTIRGEAEITPGRGTPRISEPRPADPAPAPSTVPVPQTNSLESPGPEMFFTSAPVTPDLPAEIDSIIPDAAPPAAIVPTPEELILNQLAQNTPEVFSSQAPLPASLPLPVPSPSVSSVPVASISLKQGGVLPSFDAPRPASLISQDIPSLASNQPSQPQSQNSEEFLNGAREEILPPELRPFDPENLAQLNLPADPLDFFGLPAFDLLTPEQNYLDWLAGNADLADLLMVQNFSDVPLNPAPENESNEIDLRDSLRLSLGDSQQNDLPSWARDLLSGTQALPSLESGSGTQTS